MRKLQKIGIVRQDVRTRAVKPTMADGLDDNVIAKQQGKRTAGGGRIFCPENDGGEKLSTVVQQHLFYAHGSSKEGL